MRRYKRSYISIVDGRCADVRAPPKIKGEAQHVIDLIWEKSDRPSRIIASGATAAAQGRAMISAVGFWQRKE